MKRGFVIVTRNYLRKWGEIDIIARKGQKLHFVEVKTVSRPHQNAFGQAHFSHVTDGYRPEDNLHPWKLRRLSRVIQTYLLGYDQKRGVSYETDWQFDVITVYLDNSNGRAQVRYIEDVVL